MAIILETVLTILILARNMTLRLDFEAIAKSHAGIVMAATILTVQMTMYSKLLLPAYALIGVIVYLAFLRLLKTLRQEDIDLIRSYLGNRLAFAANLLCWILL